MGNEIIVTVYGCAKGISRSIVYFPVFVPYYSVSQVYPLIQIFTPPYPSPVCNEWRLLCGIDGSKVSPGTGDSWNA